MRLLILLAGLAQVSGDCLSTPGLEGYFKRVLGAPSLPSEGSCCQKDVCNIPCAAEHDKPHVGFIAAIAVSIVASCVIGILSYYFVRGKTANFFVAGRTLPLPVVALTLIASALDSNALLGNVDLSYKFQFWDGAVLPIGLGFALILNGVFLARFIRREEVLTLPEVYGRHYGPLVEICVSLITITSFIALLAGNLVGMAKIISFTGTIDYTGAVFLSGAIIYSYTLTGGFFAIATTDVFQMVIGILGALVCSYWFIANSPIQAAPPSIGLPGYTYPDLKGAGGACDLYEGVPCVMDANLCCYNTAKWCPSPDSCVADNAAWPVGDLPIFYNEMSDPYALSPFPSSIYWNWATIVILGFGNLGALDFQARCMASKTEFVATMGCLIAGCLCFFIGVPFSYLGAITRNYYGPDSIYAEFEADTCSKALGLPTCGLWLPDQFAFLRMMTNGSITNPFVGGWTLVAIVAASMSTASGAILAMSTVAAHNLARKLPFGINNDNLVLVAQVAGLPFTVCSCCIAAFASRRSTGYLLVVAFDIMLAGCVVPLFGCFYLKDASPYAAFASVIGGSFLRVILEFTLPKDGLLILPYPGDVFLNYGVAASDLLPSWFDGGKEQKWDPEGCSQERLRDFTGVDSLASPVYSMILFFGFIWYEKRYLGGKRIGTSWWLTPTPKPPDEAKDTDTSL